MLFQQFLFFYKAMLMLFFLAFEFAKKVGIMSNVITYDG